MTPLKRVSVKYKNWKHAVQNPDFQLIWKRNKPSGTVNAGLIWCYCCSLCFDLSLQKQP